MKSVPKAFLLPLLICLVSGILYHHAPAQTRVPFSVQINISEYEVMFLADFFDVKTDQLSTLASGFSIDISGPPAPKGIYLFAQTDVQLRGSKSAEPLTSGYTKTIPFNGSRTLSARDFAKDGIVSPDPQREKYDNSILKKKIRDLALTNSTAPPGNYTTKIRVYDAATNAILGEDAKTINVVYGTPDEAFVEINEPKTGSYFNNLAPTFSWTSAEPNVTVRVYEAGLNHRSPQDALSGSNPYLEQKVVAANTLTYPASAARQLQEGKAYVLQIEAEVVSSRGPLKNQSQPVVFRITNDNLGKILDNFMNVVPGDVSAAYSTLRAEPSNWIPWSMYGNITLDGTMLSESDLQTLLKELAAQHNVKLELSIENQ
jgi:hypothetical protein